MKLNKHISVTYLIWHLVGLLIMLVYFDVFDLIVSGLLHFSSDVFANIDPNITNQVIREYLNYIWKLMIPGVTLIVSLSLIQKVAYLFQNQHRIILSISKYINFLSKPLLIYGYGFLFLYKSAIEPAINQYQQDTPTAYIALIAFISIILFSAKFLIGKLIYDYTPKLYLWLLSVKGKGWYKRIFKEEEGGSATWSTIVDLMKYESKIEKKNDGQGYTIKEPFMGITNIQDDILQRPIFVKDDVHLVTIGMSGSGKSNCVLYPNLATYKGSVYVYDPKNELVKETFFRRQKNQGQDKKGETQYHLKNHTCYILDPFNIRPEGFPAHGFNPMALIDLKDENAGSLIGAIVEGCVMEERNSKNPHFADYAYIFIEGIIIHVLTKYPKENHNLSFVLDLLTGGVQDPKDMSVDSVKINTFKELLFKMKLNNAHGGLVQKAANVILNVGGNEFGSMVSTTFRSLKWAGEPKMRTHFKNHNYDIQQDHKTTYMLLDSERAKAKNQKRWLRVLMAFFIVYEKQQQKKDLPTLFLLDEYYQMGKNLETIKNEISLLRGFNIRIWLFFQNIRQLKEVFGDTWSDVTSSSTIQVLGVHDVETGRWVADKLGITNNHLNRIVPLLTADEVESQQGKHSDMQIIFMTDGKKLRLHRINYKPMPYGGIDMSHPSIDSNLKGHFYNY